MSSEVASLTAEQAVAGIARGPLMTGELVDVIVRLGLTPEVAGAVTEVRLTPERVEVTLALLGEVGIPTITVSRRVLR